MAIKDKAAAKKTGNTTSTREYEKAKAFVNVSVRSRDGKATRLIALPLLESNEIHSQLLNYFGEAGGDPDALAEKLAKFKDRLVLDIGFSRSAEETALDLD